MTLAEYLVDYASQDTKQIGFALIDKELDKIPNPKTREIAKQNIQNIKASNRRDFRFKEVPAMSLNEQTSAERLHIGFFGLRNAGKSSLVNAFTGQQLSLVSDIKGTTTDPVQRPWNCCLIGPIVVK